MSEQPQASALKSPAAPTTPGLQFDSRAAVPVYTNVFQASGTADEIILDFGLFDQRQAESGPASVPISQRLVLSWTTARRLADFLSGLLRHHEATRGPSVREAGAVQRNPHA